MHHGIQRSETSEANYVFPAKAKSIVDLASGKFPGTDLSEASQPFSAARQETLSLKALISDARFFAGQDIEFDSIAEHSDQASTGQLVVYRIGEDNPSRVVADALARGASGILTEQLLPCPLPQCIVGDMEVALSEIAAQQAGHPDRQLLTIGVIGSAGKTSTSLLISSLLRSSSIRTAYQTDLGESDGLVQSTADAKLPTNRELVQWLLEAKDSQCKATVIELSETEARHGKYDAIQFDILVICGAATGIDDFGPSGLQCSLERVATDGVVIAPADETGVIREIQNHGLQTLTYGVRKNADVTAQIFEQSNGMTTLLVTHQDSSTVMETSLCGEAMAANLAAATLVGLLLAEPLQKIVEKLSQLRTIPGRGQRLEQYGHATVVIDAGGSPARAVTAMRTFRDMKAGGRLWCVLAIDSKSEADILAQYGTQLERFTDHAIVTATNDSRAGFLAASHKVLDGVTKCAAFRLVANRQRAIEWAVSEAAPNDTLLIITGEQGLTAHEQRSDLKRVTECVERTQQADHAASDSNQPKLSIFGS
ncbi:MAG: Mur ligase family protein [Rubripirellula sp.]|nr:Mur ligase family protein [Rubripirellula sp.]